MDDHRKLSAAKAYSVPLIIMAVLGLILFLPAGSLKFWEAWTWWSIIAVMTLFITAFFMKKDPRLLSRRMKIKEKEAQPLIIRVLSFLSLLAYVVPGFDFRFDWSAVPVGLVIASNAMVLLGYIFIFMVFRENSYASTVIQVDEEQQVIKTGPYALVRHPMYTGLLLMMMFTPMALGSYWALIFAAMFIPVIIKRIKKEEELLVRELAGYKEYLAETPYRLIPSIW